MRCLRTALTHPLQRRSMAGMEWGTRCGYTPGTPGIDQAHSKLCKFITHAITSNIDQALRLKELVPETLRSALQHGSAGAARQPCAGAGHGDEWDF
ncbi:hypothetical protein EVAR_46563_1 [Eumeta japonica]|uniref:Uncharacterized protein n=1 Tax=Eumeta variegata TaxID=151549 RepID=A0A4C1XPZ1_EUMVA|nr:hypothetical protein EVAR_46563_1 [Eumeta japonica]